MTLWMATLLIIVSAVCAAVFIKRYRESKKAWFLVLTVIACLLSLAFAGYAALTFIFVGGIN
jgi:multidrug transporter EmrE-like cation transporter